MRRAGAADATFLIAMLVEAASRGRRTPGGPPRDVLADPTLAPYVAGWPRPGDLGVLAEEGGRPVGAAWARLFPADAPAYGFVRADVSSATTCPSSGSRPCRIGTGPGRAVRSSRS